MLRSKIEEEDEAQANACFRAENLTAGIMKQTALTDFQLPLNTFQVRVQSIKYKDDQIRIFTLADLLCRSKSAELVLDL